MSLLMKLNLPTYSLTLVLVFSSILGLGGCVEVAPDRGVVYGSPDRVGRTGVQEVLVTAKVVDENRRALPGVAVSAETKRGKDSGITNSNGETLLHCDVAQFERVDFFFEYRGKIQSYTVESMPKGLEAFKAEFKISKADGVQLISTEY